MYIIEVEISDNNTNETLPTFIHKFIPDDEEELMKDLPSKIKSFNGDFIIEVEGQVLFKSILRNGIVLESRINELYLMREYPCTASGIISCADDAINGMNWIEYGFCLAGAPACLARVYLSCGWQSC